MKKLSVWHVNYNPGAPATDGISSACWNQATALAAAGVDVGVITSETSPAATAAAEAGVQVELASTLSDVVVAVRAVWISGMASVFHFHGLFRPAHTTAAHVLRASGGRWVVQPHSALAPVGLERFRHRKATWLAGPERVTLRQSAAIVCLTDVEAADAERHAGPAARTVVANPLPVEVLDGPRWEPTVGHARPRVVTLCRYDVRQKGLDRIVQVAHRLPDMDFVVHGTADHNEPRRLAELRSRAPENFTLAGPVFGDDKQAVLTGCDLYLQPSRWEGLSVSVNEALAAGVPVACSQYVGDTLGTGRDNTLVLDDDSDVAARQIHDALTSRRDGMVERASHGPAWARANLHPDVVVSRLHDLYERAA
jgi:glycosyltransferase involved in cell wall biosynthesis